MSANTGLLEVMNVLDLIVVMVAQSTTRLKSAGLYTLKGQNLRICI